MGVSIQNAKFKTQNWVQAHFAFSILFFQLPDADPNARTALKLPCYMGFRLLKQAGWGSGRAQVYGCQMAWSPSRGGGCAGFIFGRVATVSTAQPGEVASGKVTTVLAAREGLKPQEILSGLQPRAENHPRLARSFVALQPAPSGRGTRGSYPEEQ